jgi:hypothetical protein
MHAPLDRNIVLEVYFRGNAEFQTLSELRAQESRRAPQTRLYPRQGFRAGQGREENLRVGKVGGDFDPGERDHADARVFEFGVQQLGQFALDLIGDAAQALRVGHEVTDFERSDRPSNSRSFVALKRFSGWLGR